MGSRLIDFAVDNRAAVILMSLALAAGGFWAAANLPVDAVPDVTNIQVQVMTTAPALAPQDVERQITGPVELVMGGLPRLTEMRSVSQFGLSVVTLVFEEGTDIYWARAQVGERLTAIRDEIPSGVPPPQLGPLATGLGEIFQFEVKAAPGHTATLMERREALDWLIAPRLRSLSGVNEVNTSGGEARAYEVRPDPAKMLDAGVSAGQLLKALRENNMAEGGGYLLEPGGSEQRVFRGEALVRSLDDLRNTAIETRGNGTPVYLKQVATVEFSPLLRQGASTRDGKGEAVVGVVMLLVGENSREVVNHVKARLDEIRPTLPPNIEIDVFYDRSELIAATVHTLGKNLVEGGILVVAVLLFTLGSLRAGLVVALAVPLSMAGAFLGMWLAGLSGNLMSLGAIDFGLIVDGPVVLIEHVVRRLAERKRAGQTGAAPPAMVREACLEVARPVVFGVAIILFVYLPILSLRGVEGKMFRPMALTVIFALLTSLVLALTLMPALAAAYLRGTSDREPWLVRVAGRIYRPLLARSMAHPGIALASAAGLFLASVAVAMTMGAEFIPKLDEGSIALQATRLPSVSLEHSVEMTTQMEKCLLSFPEVTSVVSKIGRPEVANDPMPVNLTDVIVSLKPPEEWRFATKDELVAAMAEKLAKDAPASSFAFGQPIEMRVGELVAGVRADIGVSISGDDLGELRRAAREVARALSSVPGAADVQPEPSGGLPSLRAEIRRDKLARHGITAREALDVVSLVGGREVGAVYEGRRRFPVVARFGAADRGDSEAIGRLRVADSQGRAIPLSELADLEMTEGPAQVSRDAGRRRTIVSCNVRGRDLASFVADAQKAVAAQVTLPPDYVMTWGGQFENLQEATARLSLAVPAALLMIFALLVTAFGSARLAGLVFLNVPLAATGGVFALWLRGLDLSVSAGVGFIALFGVAVLNGVVLVSEVIHLRAGGMASADAASEGAASRLRPVLMTALVAMLGFVPMALSTSAGAEVQRPLATVVIGGLMTSTLVTLLVLPGLLGRGWARKNSEA